MNLEEYGKALKLGKREVAVRKAEGLYPYLEVLDDIPEAANSIMEYPLGLVQNSASIPSTSPRAASGLFSSIGSAPG